MHPLRLIPTRMLLLPCALLAAAGCNDNENRRLAEFAASSNQRQAEQNRQMANLHQEMIQGTRRLVESEAEARTRFVDLRREIEAASTEVAGQRDKLEEERKTLALERRSAPIIAAAVMSTGTVLACLLPIALAIRLLTIKSDDAADQLLTEALIEDLVAPIPSLTASVAIPRLSDRSNDSPTRHPDISG